VILVALFVMVFRQPRPLSTEQWIGVAALVLMEGVSLSVVIAASRRVRPPRAPRS
jgi:hypothetical protein